MKRVMSMLLAFTLALGAFSSVPSNVTAVNPYLPLWEHLPDGEPRVFEDPDHPGKYRIYIIGSHDTRYTSYCGPDIRVWSAPVDDVDNWRDEGVVFSYYSAASDTWDTMYAPDLVEVLRRDSNGDRTIKEYYLYPHSRGPGREAMVAKSTTGRPEGPYEPINVNDNGTLFAGSTMGFDPSVFIEYVDDPNDPDYKIGFRAYGFYGFQVCIAVELDQNTMYSRRQGGILNGQEARYFIPSSSSYGVLRDPSGTSYPYVVEGEDLGAFNFFEAASIRKYEQNGKSIYIWVYSGYSGPDYGIGSTNSALRYCYGDSPLGPWKSGGVLVDSRAVVPNENGTGLTTTYSGHNTHGSIELIRDQWYAFYHRAPRGYNGSRQPMVAPVTIDWDGKSVADGGLLSIRGYDAYADDGIWTAKGGGSEYTGAEVTSEGFQIYGLDPYRYYSAGIASYLSNHQVQADAWDIWNNHAPITNVQNGNIVGYKYFGFGGLDAATASAVGLKAFEGTKAGNDTVFNLWYTPQTPEAVTIEVWLDGPWDNAAWNGTKIGEITGPANSANQSIHGSVNVSSFVDSLTGKNAIFLTVKGGPGNLVDITGLGFSTSAHQIAPPEVPKVSIMVDGVEINLPDIPVRSTDVNGITDYTVYETEIAHPFDATAPPVVTASAEGNADVSSITQITAPFGTAVVKFDLKEPGTNYITEKTFNIVFVSDATYSISADSVTFGVLKPPYTQPEAQTVTITNTGTGQVTLEQPAATNYEIGELSKTILTEQGDTAAFTIRPKADLSLGDYAAVIQVVGRASGDSGSNERVTALAGAGFSVGDAWTLITITGQPADAAVAAGSITGSLSVAAAVGWAEGLEALSDAADPCSNEINITVTPWDFNGALIPTSGFVNGQNYTIKFDITTRMGSNGGFRLRYRNTAGIHSDDAAHSTDEATAADGVANQIPARYLENTVPAGGSGIIIVVFEAGLAVDGQLGSLDEIGLFGLYGEEFYTVNAVQIVSNESGKVVGFYADEDYYGELTNCTCDTGSGAGGDLPELRYQWYSNTTKSNTGGSAITGATGAAFTIPTTLSAGDYHYYAVVRADGALSVASDVVTVVVEASVSTDEDEEEDTSPDGVSATAIIFVVLAILVVAGVAVVLIKKKKGSAA
ncbi:MAG: hypothetical protein LBI19_07240 [Oscillospiraceae bacterium]|jgi:hypothetical protein|nr:hypothetical protein [Oscillospiraceae bacterium]